MDYKNGKIYMIYACVDGADEVYIGSTTQTLSKRMSGHRSSYNHKYKGEPVCFSPAAPAAPAAPAGFAGPVLL